MYPYDLVGADQIIGAASDPDLCALMSGQMDSIQQTFTGRVPALRSAMARLANLNNLQQRTPFGGFGVGTNPYGGGIQAVVDAGRLAAAVANNTPVALGEKDCHEAYEVPFGFQSLAVAAGATVQIQLQPAATFKPNRMSIPQAIAPSFQLTAFLIGQVSVILNGNAVPAEAFSDVAFNPRGWKLPTIQVGQPATMSWQNISGAAADLRGNFWGIFVT